MALLSLQDVMMGYNLGGRYVRAVDDVSFSLDRGETLGVVGESGCGKTSLMLTILRLLPRNARITRGRIMFDGIDLAKISEDAMRQIRWKRISIIFQNSMSALNPVFKVGDQIAEALIVHEGLSKKEAKKRVCNLFEIVGLSDVHVNNYPHEFSGGMRQRAMIAMSLSCNPDLIIGDEPVTALDVVVQDQILRQIRNIQKSRNIAMIMVSHDISVIAETCENVAVMYGGRIVEFGDSLSLFRDPRHPYTMGLFRSFPRLRGPKTKLTSIEGVPPNLLYPPEGCLFKPRCPLARPVCETRPTRTILDPKHFSECHFASDPELRNIQFGG